MKLSCSAYQAGSSYTQKILSGHMQNYGATSSTTKAIQGESTAGLLMPSWKVEEIEGKGSPIENPDSPDQSSSQGQSDGGGHHQHHHRGGGHAMGEHSTRKGVGRAQEESSRNTSVSSHSDLPPDRHSDSTTKTHDSSRSPSESPATRYGLEGRSRSKSVGEQHWTNLRAVMAWYARLRRIKRSKSNQRWMKLRTTVQLSGAISSTIQKKAPLKREDSFLKRFSTRQIPEAQETFEIGDDEGGGPGGGLAKVTRKKKRSLPRSVVNPDGNFYFYWLMLLTFCVLYNLWTLIVRQSFPELQAGLRIFWIVTDAFSDLVFVFDIAVQFRTGYLEQGLMVYKTKKLAKHYIGSRAFYLDFSSLVPTDLFQLYLGSNPMLRFPRFLKVYRIYNYYYMVESRTVYPNVWRVVNLIHILLLLAHWFGCFYFVLSKAENFIGQWSFPDPKNNTDFDSLTRKYLASLYWSTLTLTTIGDLPTPYSNWQYLFTIVSYLIGVFIFATIVGQVGNVITNRNANRLEFERLLDGAKMYMRHHKVPRDMQRRVLRWYDYSWSRGRIQGGGDINTALGLLPDKLKTELALHVNLSVLKKVTIFQECQPEFLHDLVLKMKAYIFTPGDLICRKGEVAREMFIIADGILEVISEQGKVLTTMQAGDFFGEIGILNLDGLNKRTADVRSVGYSELFSLSREDVLAAMKDYPEAQEILQTLGRKRLMEARKANAPAPKKPDVKKVPPTASHLSLAPSQSSLSHKGPDTSETDNTSKRIVEKLRSDVRGLRNAIRRSRKSNSSKEDSSEPESGKDKSDSVGIRSRKESMSQDSKSSLSSSARGVLKRMHHVLSDEKDKDKDGGGAPSGTSPSSATTRRVQLPGAGSAAMGADDESGGEQGGDGGEPQVIGAGLPLIQRLRLLKKKEEKQGRAAAPPAAAPAAVSIPGVGSSSVDVTPASSQRSSTTTGGTDGTVLQTKVSIETPPKLDKESGKLSTNDSSVPGSSAAGGAEVVPSSLARKSSSVTGATDAAVAAATTAAAELRSPPPYVPFYTARRPTVTSISSADSSGADPLMGTVIIGGSSSVIGPGSSSMMTPSSITSRQDSSSSESNSYASRFGPSAERPSMLQLKKRNKKTYGSVDDLSPEFARLPFIKKLKILNERQKIAELLTTKTSNVVLTRSTSEGSNETPVPGTNDSTMHSVLLGRRTQSSSEQYTTDIVIPPPLPPDHPLFFLPPLTPSNENEPDDSSATNCLKYKQDNFTTTTTISTTTTTSTTTSATVTCTSNENTTTTTAVPSNNNASSNVTTKSMPNTTTTSSSTRSSTDSATTSSLVLATTAFGSVNRSSSDRGSRDSTSPPLSPESNETPERRNLKSILKKLAEESGSVDSSEDETGGKGGSFGSGSSSGTNKSSSGDYHQLLRAPTIEGYAARHRKFSKNVTFQRQQAIAVISPEGPETSPGQQLQQQHQPKAQQTTGDSSSSVAVRPPPLSSDRESLQAQLASLALFKEGGGRDAVSGETLEALGMTQEEYIGGVFLGIRNIIQSSVEDMHVKFSDKFASLETEVRQRDEIIDQLQRRLQELEMRSNSSSEQHQGEEGGLYQSNTNNNNHHHHHVRQRRRNSSSSSRTTINDELDIKNSEIDPALYHSDEFSNVHSYLFSRDNSVDTVITNQDFDDDDVFVPSSDSENQQPPQQTSIKAQQITQVLQIDQQKQHQMENNKALALKQSTTKWSAEISKEETIEMREFSAPVPLWELEFHRDSASSSSRNQCGSDSVAVDIGSTSTEYESSSSSDEGDQGGHGNSGNGRKKLERSNTVIERKLSKDPGDTSGEEEEEEDDDDENDDGLESSGSSSEESAPQLTNQNWEVQMLAKEMEKREERSRGGSMDKGELQELEDEIRQMQDAVSQGALSPTELDMLEAVLETKTKKIKGLYKAYSVEASGTSHHVPPSRLLSSKSKVGRSVDDFRQRPVAPQNLFLSSRGSSSRSSKTLSPGERRDLQKLVFSRKRGGSGVKRQASLCESTTGWRHDAGRLASPSSSASAAAAAAMTTSFSSFNKSDHHHHYHHQQQQQPQHQHHPGKRRESADSVIKLPSESSSKSSFFSRLSFVRQFSRTLHSSKSVDETGLEQSSHVTSSAIPIHAPVHSSPKSISLESQSDVVHHAAAGSTTSNQPSSMAAAATGQKTTTGSSTLTQKSSSVGLLPLISSTISSALSTSVKSDPGSASGPADSSSPPRIFTIPSASIPAAQPDHHHHQKYLGESQPLLKKK